MMDGLGNQFLAGTMVATDQDPGICGGNPFDLGAQLADNFSISGEPDRFPGLGAQDFVLIFKLGKADAIASRSVRGSPSDLDERTKISRALKNLYTSRVAGSIDRDSPHPMDAANERSEGSRGPWPRIAR